jgi:predicted ester cyclase
MSTEENKALMHRIYEEVFNQKNLVAIDDFIAPNFVNHSAAQLGMTGGDLEHVKQFLSMVMQVFPDLHYTVEDLVAEGDKVVARLTISGTQQGAFMGIPPTGKHATISDIEIFRITGGKAVETWVQVDFLGLLQQLGAIPPMR